MGALARLTASLACMATCSMSAGGASAADAAAPLPAACAATPPATIIGYARTTLGLFNEAGEFEEREIAVDALQGVPVRVCAWNRRINLMQVLIGARVSDSANNEVGPGALVWVDAAELKLQLAGTAPATAACADAPSRPSGSQSLASMGVGTACTGKPEQGVDR